MKVSHPVREGLTLTVSVESAFFEGPLRWVLPAEVAGQAWPDAPSWPGDAALVAALLAAMRQGVDLEIDAPVSARLLEGADRIQDIFCTWDQALRPAARCYQRVAVTPTGVQGPSAAATPDTTPRPRTAAFFTGGVDSFFTAQRHRDVLDALVYVEGFDVAVDDVPLRTAVREHLQAAAHELGLPLVLVESDLRKLGRASRVSWPDQHGSALASIAHLLAPWFERVLIPSTHTYAHLEGLGSHPLVDPLWSSESMEIVHDGAHATRVDKLRAIATLPAAQHHLRVCWENRGGRYNCGRCEKCVRTFAAALAAGVSDRLPTLPAASLRRIARVEATGRGSSWEDVAAALAATGSSRKLAAAVDRIRARHRRARTKALRERYRQR